MFSRHIPCLSRRRGGFLCSLATCSILVVLPIINSDRHAVEGIGLDASSCCIQYQLQRRTTYHSDVSRAPICRGTSFQIGLLSVALCPELRNWIHILRRILIYKKLKFTIIARIRVLNIRVGNIIFRRTQADISTVSIWPISCQGVSGQFKTTR